MSEFFIKNLLIIGFITLAFKDATFLQAEQHKLIEKEENQNVVIMSPNVLLIIVDTLGAKHMDVYEPGINSTPNILELAKKSAVFERAYASSPWTKPSITSIFTGLNPSSHGVTKLRSKVSSELKTLAETLKDNGYVTFGVVSHTFLNDDIGFAQGFDSYKQVNSKNDTHTAITSKHVSEEAASFIENHKKVASDKPFFLTTHYFDPHFVYQHHKEFDRTSTLKSTVKIPNSVSKLRKIHSKLKQQDIDYLKALYLEEVAFTDAQIGMLLNKIQSLGYLDNTIIIFTADHGEEFMEHGWLGHIRTLYEQVVHIPLLIYSPKHKVGLKNNTPVSQIDVLPTILDLTSSSSTNKYDGTSLVPLLNKEGAQITRRKLVSEVEFFSQNRDYNANMVAVIEDSYKLIWNRENDKKELYNISKDNNEKNNLFTTESGIAEQLLNYAKQLSKKEEALQDSGKDVVDETEDQESPEELEKLKSLGYL
jgi:arylsulfatase A-like enzyme